MKEPKKRGRPSKREAEQVKPSDSQGLYEDKEIEVSPVFIHDLKTETRTARGRETLDISVVYRVESEIGRTANAWGMVDPLELIRAVDQVLRGGEG